MKHFIEAMEKAMPQSQEEAIVKERASSSVKVPLQPFIAWPRSFGKDGNKRWLDASTYQ